MSENKKKAFGITFDPNMQPGSLSRVKNSSLDKFFGDGKLHEGYERPKMWGVDENPREKFKSQQIPQVNPTVILRKKGRA